MTKKLRDVLSYYVIFMVAYFSSKAIEKSDAFFESSSLFFFFIIFLFFLKLKNYLEFRSIFDELDLMMIPFYLFTLGLLWWWLNRWGLGFLVVGCIGFFLWLNHILHRLLEK